MPLRSLALIAILCLGSPLATQAQYLSQINAATLLEEPTTAAESPGFFAQTRTPKPGVALFLCMTAGIVGLHRLYLGTSGKTFVFYLVTAGGFGMLWFTDLVLLLGVQTTRNFDNYVDNDRILMFLDKDKG